MSYYDSFFKVYPYICFFLINITILAVLLPNRIVDTSSVNKTYVVVFLIVGGLLGLRSSFFFYSFLIFGMMFSFMLVLYVRRLNAKKHSYQTMTQDQPEFLKRVK